ncbi:hypothetical protein [Novosphingobium lentum]|uniref:hypothetical protein n=1 Tax=Novosphingobium lentum TaxID=145287 RepID=UPI00082B8BE8|nr:hypothetical protein [Novosphingobium lentum]
MSSTKRKGSPSITAHRLFPAIVALWFAALLGMGSFVVPAALIEQLVMAVHLPTVLPAATPPLGFTAHALIALVMTAIGGLLGLIIGRAIGRPRHGVKQRRYNPAARRSAVEPDAIGSAAAHSAISPDDEAPRLRSRDRHPDAPARKPLSAHEDLAELAGEPDGAANAAADVPTRRRQLALTDEGRPIDFHESAPLPFFHETYATAPVPAHDEPLPLQLFEEAGSAPAAEPSVDPDVPGHLDAMPMSGHAIVDAPVGHDTESSEHAFDRRSFDHASDAAHAGDAEVAHADGPSDEPVTSEPAPLGDDQSAPEPLPHFARPVLKPPVASTPLKDLGTVQLVERLAIAIDRRRSADPAATDAAYDAPLPPPAPAPELFEAAPAVGHQAIAEPVLARETAVAPPPASYHSRDNGVPARRVVALHSVAPTLSYRDDATLDEDDEEPFEIPRFLSRSPMGAAAAAAFETPVSEVPVSEAPVSEAPAIWSGHDDDNDGDWGEDNGSIGAVTPVGDDHADDADNDDADNDGDDHDAAVAGLPDAATGEDVAEQRYSSLLDMSPVPLRQPVLHIEEPDAATAIEPVVIFPGQAPRIAAPFDRPSGLAAVADDDRESVGPDAADGPHVQPNAPPADPAETDRALRAALATLQRMTGSR